MRKLNVDMSQLTLAMDSNDIAPLTRLDTSTGEVLTMLEEAYRAVERYIDEGSESAAFEAWAKEEACAEWMIGELRDAYRILTDYSERYVEVPPADTRDAYRDMEDFIETVEDEQFANRLWRAIEGKGAFRRFKDTLYDRPAEQERWYKFKDDCLRQRAIEWLESLDIELDEDTKEQQ